MPWKQLNIAADGTHHLRDGQPAYGDRFDDVLKFHAPGLAPVRRGTRAWHIHPDGRAAYEQRFDRTFGFYEGLAAVTANGAAWHIDPMGIAAYAERYAWCGNFQGGRCAVRCANGEYLHILNNGDALYPERWSYAGDYRDSIAVVQARDGRSTHIDQNGRLLHGCWFLDLDVFHKGYARARDERGWTHIDLHGRPAYVQRFAMVEPFYNGQARVERFDGVLQVIAESGFPLAELRPARRSDFAALSGDMVGFWKTETIATAVELGVFDSLPASADALAQIRNLDPARTKRLLRALGELGLVELAAGGQWTPTAKGRLLEASHERTLADAALEYGRQFPGLWARLPEALRAHGSWKAPDLFQQVARDPNRCEGHHRMLRSYARHDYEMVVGALPLVGNERIVDAGGGLGVLAMALAKAFPQAQVTLLEMAEVIARAREELPTPTAIELRAGDLFADWGVVADVVILARVLHDWCDEDAVRILRNARSALSSGGRLFVLEHVLPDDNYSGGLCDLHLLVATGGQERRASEYRVLLQRAGFELQAIRPLSALTSLIVGVAA